MTLRLVIGLALGFSVSGMSLAAESGSPAPAPAKGAAVGKGPALLDFEADVIEGKKRAPDLFLQTEGEHLETEAVIMIRKDFNEFHEKDRRRRPRLSR